MEHQPPLTHSHMDQSPPRSPWSLLSAVAWKQRLVFWSGAIVVGLFISALTVVSERAVVLLLDFVQPRSWTLWLIPPLGIPLVACLTQRLCQGAEGSGVPQVKAALAIHHDLQGRSRLVSFRIAIGKVLLTNLGLLTGSSAGLGGPAIQIGASIMTSLGKAARFPPHYMERGFILAGSAAGFAALFSAPLAGIIFAIEELGRSLEEKIGSLVLIAIILAGMTAFILLQHYIFLDTEESSLPWGKGWLAIPLCGVAGGLAGGIFSRLLIRIGQLVNPLRMRRRILLACACGAVLAVIHTGTDGMTLGTGYPVLKQILTDPQSIQPLFCLMKALATLATALSGIPAGLFVPSLSVGAGLGSNLMSWLPFTPPLAVVLLSMCAYFSGVFQNPMTSFVLIMEITDTHEMLLPLMATAFIATGTAQLINRQPLYERLTEGYAKRFPDSL